MGGASSLSSLSSESHAYSELPKGYILSFKHYSSSSPSFNFGYEYEAVENRSSLATPAQGVNKPDQRVDLEIGDEVAKTIQHLVGGKLLGLVHTGIYIGRGFVISKYQDPRKSDKAVLMLELVKQWSGWWVNRKGHKLAALRVLTNFEIFLEDPVRFEYEIRTKNCQHFTQKCLQLSPEQ